MIKKYIGGRQDYGNIKKRREGKIVKTGKTYKRKGPVGRKYDNNTYIEGS